MSILNPKTPSNMKHDFGHVPTIQSRRSKFSQPGRLVTMFDSGKLIPIECKEILPGDSLRIDNTYLCRLATPIVPFMDNLYMDTQFFFVPNRLVWENFKKQMGEKADPDSSTDYTTPVVTAPAGGHTVESLADYFGGIRIGVEKDVNALPFRAYNLIYNNFYRDQKIIDSITVDTDDGPDLDTLYAVRRRGKRFDYFTSCLVSPQSGNAVSIAMTGDAPVEGIGKATQVFSESSMAVYETDGSGTVTYPTSDYIDAGGSHTFQVEQDGTSGYPNIRANLSGVSAVTISAWREALQLQALAEMEMRGGTRYIELVYSEFQVQSPDARLQRPEYLGGSSTPIYVNPVAQTESTNATTPQGNLSAYAVGVKKGDGFYKSFTEHGFVIGIASVRADLTYSQGVHRKWTRATKYDYAHPLLQNIGDQTVLTEEIFCVDDSGAGETANAVIFGYAERYAEYMYGESYITGKLRPDYATSLDYWHLSQEFSSAPTLDQNFIEENPPVDRVVAVTDEPQFILDVWKNTTMTRPLGRYSLPGYLGSRL